MPEPKFIRGGQFMPGGQNIPGGQFCWKPDMPGWRLPGGQYWPGGQLPPLDQLN